MQDLVDKLQSKVKSYKRQFEEAVSTLGSGHPEWVRVPRNSVLAAAPGPSGDLWPGEKSVQPPLQGSSFLVPAQ